MYDIDDDICDVFLACSWVSYRVLQDGGGGSYNGHDGVDGASRIALRF